MTATTLNLPLYQVLTDLNVPEPRAREAAEASIPDLSGFATIKDTTTLVAAVEHRLTAKLDRLEQLIARSFETLTLNLSTATALQASKTDSLGSALKAAMTVQAAELKAHMTVQAAELKAHMTVQAAELKAHMRVQAGELKILQQQMIAGFAGQTAKAQEQEQRLNARLDNQDRLMKVRFESPEKSPTVHLESKEERLLRVIDQNSSAQTKWITALVASAIIVILITSAWLWPPTRFAGPAAPLAPPAPAALPQH